MKVEGRAKASKGKFNMHSRAVYEVFFTQLWVFPPSQNFGKRERELARAWLMHIALHSRKSPASFAISTAPLYNITHALPACLPVIHTYRTWTDYYALLGRHTLKVGACFLLHKYDCKMAKPNKGCFLCLTYVCPVVWLNDNLCMYWYKCQSETCNM